MTEMIQITSLDHHFADFVTRIDCNPCDELWLAAALASYFAGRGHTCFDMTAVSGQGIVPFSGISRRLPVPEAPHWKTALAPCDTVGCPGDYTPLVLERSGRLYLHRSWEFERRVAEGILSRNRRIPCDMERLNAALDHFFPAASASPDLQRKAALTALTRRFSVISGGPGTGKTATVARILALLIELAGDKQPEIALAAPTGKAAIRLRQSILEAAGRLDFGGEARTGLPGEVSTIHRLLGVRGNGEGFRYNRDNRLSCDILVIDEASMIDLPLMTHVLEALRDDAGLILLGDRDQLASVEAGAVLADICDKAAAQPALQEGSPGGDGVPVTQLTKSYRFGENSGIASISRLINSGDGAAAFDMLVCGDRDDLVWRPLPSGRSFEDCFFSAVKAGYSDYAKAATPEEALAELDRFRVLSPLRSGPYGTENLNRLCHKALGLPLIADDRYCGHMPVLVSANNYELGLFNGDTGVFMDYDGRTSVWFNAQEGGLRRLSPLRLPAHDSAFAMTVHKSQGSEFDKLLLILPERMSEVLSRELLYTAVTRARVLVEIWCTEEVFVKTVERRTGRNSGLSEKLAGQMS